LVGACAGDERNAAIRLGFPVYDPGNRRLANRKTYVNLRSGASLTALIGRMGVALETVEIYEKLTSVFHDVFDDDSLVLTPQLSADDVDEWDSLSHLRLILTVQKTFAVKLSAAEIGKLKNVGELVELIQAKVYA
jgi:acyl carrier protein